ncbi:MAG: transglycosylase SLT domain-containing protein [Aminivibrio sp.]|jgi:soluble lytic murein transglycosylase-like protein
MRKKSVSFALGIFCAILIAITFNAQTAFSQPFSNSQAFHNMQNHRSKTDQAKRLKAIETYFRKKNPKIPLKNISYYAQLVEDCSARYNLDPFLVASVMVKESTIKEKAVSKGNYGLMQINWKANRPWIVKNYPIRSTKELLTPSYNVSIGTHILAANIKKCKGDVDRGLDRYRGRSLASYRNSIHQHYQGISEIFRRL